MPPRRALHLALFYDGGGGGVPDDIVRAYAWIACATGHAAGDDISPALLERALEFKHILQSRMTSEQVASGERLAAEWNARRP